MYQQTYQGINSCLVDLCQQLQKNGVKRKTRGYNCIELPEPVLFKIEKPTARWITLPERKWNITLPYAESLWIATGRNDLEFIQYYLKKMGDFSDDNQSIRAGYGPRLRFYDGQSLDYCYASGGTNTPSTTDQFAYLEQLLKKEPNSRRGLLTIGNPLKDQFSTTLLKKTKDYPCTCTLHFYLNNEKALDLIVHMRSNDLIWGLSAVNVFNFTFIQEYFSAILGVPLGAYYHCVNNLHYYERHQKKVDALAKYDPVLVENPSFEYQKNFTSLAQFDQNLQGLSNLEYTSRKPNTLLNADNIELILEQRDPFFKDWAKVLLFKSTKQLLKYDNPILAELIKDKFLA